jgi:hypothetical protein
LVCTRSVADIAVPVMVTITGVPDCAISWPPLTGVPVRDRLAEWVPVAAGLKRMGREMDWDGFRWPAHLGWEKKEGDTWAFHCTISWPGLVNMISLVLVLLNAAVPISSWFELTEILGVSKAAATTTSMVARLLSLYTLTCPFHACWHDTDWTHTTAWPWADSRPALGVMDNWDTGQDRSQWKGVGDLFTSFTVASPPEFRERWLGMKRR